MFGKKTLMFLLLLVFSACLSFAGGSSDSGAAKSSGGGQPDWVRDPYAKYDKQANLAAVGNGSSRQAAERDALGKLVAIFGQSIQVDDKISTSYREAVTSGVIASWSENTSADSTITTSASMDTLVGAEIGDAWDNGKDHYAVAVLNKTKTAMTYSGMIQTNQTIINNLVDNIPAAERNTLEGVARYQFAGMIADVNVSYGNVLSVIGAPALAQGLKSGGDYRLEAQNIAKTIPVGIIVNGDRAGRIQGAFAKAFSDLGFQSGGNNSRYVLRVDISTEPVELAGQQNKFTRITVDANLTDTSTNTVLVPFNFNSREGHATQSEADNRVYLAAERKIAGEYKDAVSDYLSQLLPKK